MRKIREVLRPYFAAALSIRAIARSLGTSPSTVAGRAAYLRHLHLDRPHRAAHRQAWRPGRKPLTSDNGLAAKGFHDYPRVVVTIPCAILVRILRDHLGQLRKVQRSCARPAERSSRCRDSERRRVPCRRSCRTAGARPRQPVPVPRRSRSWLWRSGHHRDAACREWTVHGRVSIGPADARGSPRGRHVRGCLSRRAHARTAHTAGDRTPRRHGSHGTGTRRCSPAPASRQNRDFSPILAPSVCIRRGPEPAFGEGGRRLSGRSSTFVADSVAERAVGRALLPGASGFAAGISLPLEDVRPARRCVRWMRDARMRDGAVAIA